MSTRVSEIRLGDTQLDEAFCPQSVTVVLEDDLDVSRGDMIIGLEDRPGAATDLRARVCWMRRQPLRSGVRFLLKHTSLTTPAVVAGIEHRLDMATLEPAPAPPELELNDLGEIRLRTARPIVFDAYATNRLMGSFILIEEGTNATVAAGMLVPPTEVAPLADAGYTI